MKKYLKITLLVVVAAIFIGTFIFLYQKSKPKTTVYETVTPEIADLEKTTVATGKVEPRDEVLIKPQISGIISEVYEALEAQLTEAAKEAARNAEKE